MSKAIASTKGTSILVRARFGPGMLLQHEDLEQLNAYTRELSRLLFRSFFGCGVVCGLVVKVEKKCGKVMISVACGLALDCDGDPIYVPKNQEFALDDKCETEIEGPLWVLLCHTAKCCAPRSAICASDDDEAAPVCTREREGYEIRVVKSMPECTCGCHDPEECGEPNDCQTACKCADPNSACYADHYSGKCGCNCGDSSDCGCSCSGDCVVLARLYEDGEDWHADHRYRRFIRPVLMRDPQVEIECEPEDPDGGCEDPETPVGTDTPIILADTSQPVRKTRRRRSVVPPSA